MKTFCDTIYWLALTIWLSVLVAAGVAAATTFTVLPAMGLSIPAYEALPVEEHGRVAAGKVMEPIFTFVDVVQIVAASLVLVTVAAQWFIDRSSRRRIVNLVRIGAILLAAGVFTWRAATLTPGMNRELRQYWSAAETGDAAQAAIHRDAFNQMHPRASDLFSATLALLVIAVLASPSALTKPRRKPERSELETPVLSRRR